MKRISVTIGIPAYQSELNIAALLNSLIKQKQENINIQKILVYADGCTDDTVKNAKSVKNKKIQVIASRKNKGFAYALQSLIDKNNSEIFVGLNDDIRIDSNSTIQELVKPFRNKKVGLVAGNIKALAPKTFIGRCVYASFLVFEPLRYEIENGLTDLTCDGKIFALKKDFAKTLNLKKRSVGNVDIFLYYENLRQGRVYKFAKNSQIFFRLPETIKDFKSQESRAILSRKLMASQFGELFKTKHKFSKITYLVSAFKVFIQYPLETVVFKLLINKSLNLNKRSSLKWKLALTTKKLSLLFTDFESFFMSL